MCDGILENQSPCQSNIYNLNEEYRYQINNAVIIISSSHLELPEIIWNTFKVL